MIKKSSGFTVIELLIVIVVFVAASGIFLYQKNHIEASARDDRRRADINTLYFNLERVYYPTHKSYPKELNEKTLTAVQPDTFRDPYGALINTTQKEGVTGISLGESNYHYKPANCDGNQCKSYTLRATMENEADYIKKSDRH